MRTQSRLLRFQFGIKALLLLMLVVGCFLAGRMSLYSELQNVRGRLEQIEAERANQKLRVRKVLEQMKQGPRPAIRETEIDSGMKADELERRGLLRVGPI